MKPIVWAWLALSLAAECLGDITLKKGGVVLPLLMYNAMLLAWFKTVQSAGQMITVPGLVWLIGGEVLMLLVGVGMFHEPLTARQMVGAALGLVAIVLVGG